MDGVLLANQVYLGMLPGRECWQVLVFAGRAEC